MNDDAAYYLQRAEAELAFAQHAIHPAAVRAHYHLAGYYLDKAHCAEPVIVDAASVAAPEKVQAA